MGGHSAQTPQVVGVAILGAVTGTILEFVFSLASGVAAIVGGTFTGMEGVVTDNVGGECMESSFSSEQVDVSAQIGWKAKHVPNTLIVRMIL